MEKKTKIIIAGAALIVAIVILALVLCHQWKMGSWDY